VFETLCRAPVIMGITPLRSLAADLGAVSGRRRSLLSGAAAHRPCANTLITGLTGVLVASVGRGEWELPGSGDEVVMIYNLYIFDRKVGHR
jgi:hypothetical protein